MALDDIVALWKTKNLIPERNFGPGGMVYPTCGGIAIVRRALKLSIAGPAAGSERVKEMPGKNHYTLYKGYKLYYPMGHDLLKDSAGRYAVYVVLSRPSSNTVERIVVPGCFADTLREAEKLSIEHARRLVDEARPIESVALKSALRGTDKHAG